MNHEEADVRSAVAFLLGWARTRLTDPDEREAVFDNLAALIDQESFECGVKMGARKDGWRVSPDDEGQP